MGGDDPDDDAVVEAAATAAENVIFSRYDNSELRDIDVTVTFEDGQLEVDVYLDAPGDAEQVAEDAVLAARRAADDLLL
ncbi:DUF3194 domain-containing protein [Halobacteriales archaeon SW_7_65_23]|jgi:hypothetical protein|nr:MAG: DUF3194 domain-containing protein [Halobacteriales archaeon SW_7_65_23]